MLRIVSPAASRPLLYRHRLRWLHPGLLDSASKGSSSPAATIVITRATSLRSGRQVPWTLRARPSSSGAKVCPEHSPAPHRSRGFCILETTCMDTIGTPLLWAGFAAFLVIALAVDLWADAQHRPAQGQQSRSADLERGLDRPGAASSTPGCGGTCAGSMPDADADPRRDRVPDRLPGGEGAGGRQHLRVPDAVHLLRGAGAPRSSACWSTACSARSCCARS